MNKDIFLTNSYGGKKENFKPINKNNIKMYVCGPTVYDDPHIGNARPLVVFDILFKVLKCKYGHGNVTYVRNITDIDDKIIQSAKDKKIAISELTSKININFQEDCDYLNCEQSFWKKNCSLYCFNWFFYWNNFNFICFNKFRRYYLCENSNRFSYCIFNSSEPRRKYF